MLRARLSYFLLALLFPLGLFAQNQTEDRDSLVRLLGCNELRQVEHFGQNVREAFGNARFQHNGTILICDTALWYVTDEVINAIGHVKIIQDETMLTSDKLDYLISENLAQFRGSLVQLEDKKLNILRTNNLDYNTKDSVAVFYGGGSMKDENGQIIESDNGTYDSKIKTFFFDGSVNMFTDSIFIKTDHLEYNTDLDLATFGTNTNAWKDNDMLSSNGGWYDRGKEEFLFRDNVHLLTEAQEGWADTLKYYRFANDAEMFGNAEVIDTSRNVSSVAGYMYYCDSLSRLIMRRDPAIILKTVQDSTRDTVYVGADEMVYWTVPKCELPEEAFTLAKKRMADLDHDAIASYRKSASAEAARQAEDAKKQLEEQDPNAFNSVDRGRGGGRTQQQRRGESLGAPPDGLGSAVQDDNSQMNVQPVPSAGSDSLEIASIRNSLAEADSIALAKSDSTKIGFALALRNVKVFKSDIQMSCDSLEYNDLDSLVRMYINPIVWNEENRQYTADSITVMIRNQMADRASLMSNAFIIVQEDTASYDQIKATDMMAYFDSASTLKRFDAMGDASGIFYLEENHTLATVNKFEAKMLTATFKDGFVDTLNYFQNVKSDAYPVVQMKRSDRYLRNFKWLADKRPTSSRDVTSLVPREPQRAEYEAIPHATFIHTGIYFPGYMDGVYSNLAMQDSLKSVRSLQRDSIDRAEAQRRETAAQMRLAYRDSLSMAMAANPALSEYVNDKGVTAVDSLGLSIQALIRYAKIDSLNRIFASDSLRFIKVDSLRRAGADSLLHRRDTLLFEAVDSLMASGMSFRQSVLKANGHEEKVDLQDSGHINANPPQKSDSLTTAPPPPADTVVASRNSISTQNSQSALKKEKISRAERRKARWEELNKRDQEKAAKKAAKDQAKQRKKNLKTLRALDKRAAKEQKFFERYKARYEKKKAREDAREARKNKESATVTEASSSGS